MVFGDVVLKSWAVGVARQKYPSTTDPDSENTTLLMNAGISLCWFLASDVIKHVLGGCENIVLCVSEWIWESLPSVG